MAIDLLTLFVRLGRIAHVIRSQAHFRAAGLGTDVEDSVDEYDASTLRALVSPITESQAQAKAAAGDLVPTLVSTAQETLRRMVEADQPARTWTVEEAVEEVVRQVVALSQSVPQCTTALTVTALTPFAGDGLLVTTLKGGGSESVAGVLLENIFTETLWLTCATDAQTGGATQGREQFRFRGGLAEADVWGDLWPAGSGGDANLLAADPASDADEDGNLLTNSSFDAFTSNAPDSWTIQVGSAGTQIDDSTTEQYAGTACLALPGTATLAAIAQDFASETGTETELLPLTRYAVSVRVKVSAVPATGTLILEITDSS